MASLATERKWVGFGVQHIMGTYDFVVLKVILGLFGALLSKWLLNHKWLAMEQNLTVIWDPRTLVNDSFFIGHNVEFHLLLKEI